jgi:two-component system, NarL family, sensor kinase
VAIREMVAQRARLGELTVQVELDPLPPMLHDRVLFVVARELVSNVLRHANAGRAVVRLLHRDDHVVLEVEDDGIGIMPAAQRYAVEHGHLGLVSSQERVAALGGTFSIESSPGGGALVRARVPVRRVDDRA